MAEFPTTARVVIIGGGVVGASCLYHLAKAGWKDCVLLEKNELTSGSTWHAAGNCPSFSTSWAIMNMQRYSLGLYRALGDEVDYPMNYHVTGSLRLGHSKERMQEFERARSMGRYQGLELEMVQVSDLKARYPFIETHGLAGALHDPDDGDIDPAQLTQALARGARQMGARIWRFTEATGVDRAGQEWIVHTTKGDIRCEKLVNAAGYYAQAVGDWFIPFGGRRVPMTVMSHQYFVTEEVPQLAQYGRENGKLPLLRDVDSSWYLRQEKQGLALGPYERNCRAHWISPDDPMPGDFAFQLFPDDLARLEWYINDAVARVPPLGTAGVSRVINGPIPYAPDGLPLIGPMPGVPNAYEACVFTFGITQAGGAGKVLAEWVTEGETEWDMWAVDPRRYTGFADQDYSNAKAVEIYGHEYAMHFPHMEWPAGRNRRLSPNHDRLIAQGAVMGAYGGWERANWFAGEGDDTSWKGSQTWERAGPWEPRVREECLAVLDRVGVLDLSGFSRFDIVGEGAAEALSGLITGALPREGRLGLAYVATRNGRVLTEFSVVRHGVNSFTLITAAAAEWHDQELLRRAMPPEVELANSTNKYSTLLVTGPHARELLEGLPGITANLDLPWLSHQQASVAGAGCTFARVSYAGELGWEIHAPVAHIPALYTAVLDAGATPFGMYALNSLRLEKGYRAWKGDLSTDYTLLEAGLDRFIKLDKPQDFPGKAAILGERQRGPAQGFVTMKVEAGPADAPYMSTVWHGDTVVGEVTSGAWGYRVGASLALGMVQIELATPGTMLEIDIYGQCCRAEVQPPGPLWDGGNARLRA